MKLFYVALLLSIVTVAKSQTPSFNGKELVRVSSVPSWNFSEKPPGWYRIAKNSGDLRANATFELREAADHSTLRFEVGVSYSSKGGSSFTVTSHSYYGYPTFPKIRLLTGDTYSDTFLEVYVDPHYNNNQPFSAYVFNALADGDWEMLNWIPGATLPTQTVTEYDTDKLFTVGNLNHKNILSVARDGNVGIGTSVPNSKLAVNGNIRAKEIKVEATNWPDYVFAKDYRLPSLAETEKHIQEKGYLPEIPSAEDVKNSGIDLGDMNAKLLKKIEELTLYLIQYGKEMEAVKAELKSLKEK